MLAFLFVALAVIFRLLPRLLGSTAFHFTPVGAALLYFGATQPRKWLWIPIAAFALTDAALNRFYHFPITADTFFSVFWYALYLAIGMVVIGKRPGVAHVLGGALAGAVGFFLVSNFLVWVGSGMYAHNFAGLAQCFTLAVPFFGNTLLSDVAFSAAMFGAPALVRHMQRDRAAATAA